jgi:hypothetical protein
MGVCRRGKVGRSKRGRVVVVRAVVRKHLENGIGKVRVVSRHMWNVRSSR